jgi:hypothetical protein
MARWRDLAEAEPEFSERLAALFNARRHKTLATLRRDGSPRVSGIETRFEDGEMIMGMMPDSVKTIDVRTDSESLSTVRRMTRLRAIRPVGGETRKSQEEPSRSLTRRAQKPHQIDFRSISKKLSLPISECPRIIS